MTTIITVVTVIGDDVNERTNEYLEEIGLIEEHVALVMEGSLNSLLDSLYLLAKTIVVLLIVILEPTNLHRFLMTTRSLDDDYLVVIKKR